MQFDRKLWGQFFSSSKLYLWILWKRERSAGILYGKLQRCVKTRVHSLKKKSKNASAKLSRITRTMGNDSANLDANCTVYRKSDVSYVIDARLSFRWRAWQFIGQYVDGRSCVSSRWYTQVYMYIRAHVRVYRDAHASARSMSMNSRDFCFTRCFTDLISRFFFPSEWALSCTNMRILHSSCFVANKVRECEYYTCWSVKCYLLIWI